MTADVMLRHSISTADPSPLPAAITLLKGAVAGTAGRATLITRLYNMAAAHLLHTRSPSPMRPGQVRSTNRIWTVPSRPPGRL